MKRRRVAPACLLALALFPAAGLAEPIPVTSGFFSVTGLSTNAFFEFQGPGLQASGNLERGVVGPDLTCFPCAAGNVISLDTRFLASLGSGTVTLDGTVFSPVTLGAMDFVFEAPDVVAPPVAGSFTVTRPFTFSGSLSGFDPSDFDETTPIFQRFLVGQGLVTASFLENPNPEGPPLFSYRSIRYDFAASEPVPEPASLLLVATGLGAALRLRRRTRASS